MPNVMAALPNIGGALCKSFIITFLGRRRSLADARFWTAGVPCSNAADRPIGERKTWT